MLYFGLECVKRLLDKFYTLYGLKCNPAKSEVFFGGVPATAKNVALKATGFKEGCLPVRYLGLPLIAGKLSAKECVVLVDKITSRIRSWRASKLSYAGKLQLVSSVLYSVVQFWMMVFVLPKNVISKMQKICSDFLWHGNDSGRAKVSWEIVATTKQEGGLDLKDLYTWNVACVGRLLWLLLVRSGSFWVAWTEKYRLKAMSVWDVRETGAGSWLWRKVLKLRPWLRFRLDVDNHRIARWEGQPMIRYSIQLVWRSIRTKKAEVGWWKVLWNKFTIPKHRFIAWLVILNRITTRSQLKTWGKTTNDDCMLCNSEPENREHLFFKCTYSYAICSAVFGTLLQIGGTWNDCLESINKRAKKGDAISTFLCSLWCWTISIIWRERCKRVHGSSGRIWQDVYHELRDEVRYYAAGNPLYGTHLRRAIGRVNL